jgi:putrescine transport system permease protein
MREKSLSNILIFLIPTIWILLFIVIPLVITLLLSFSTTDYSNILPFKLFFDFQNNYFKPIISNFSILFNDYIYLYSFLQSIEIAFCSTIITLFLAYPLAYKIAFSSQKARYILLLLVISPFWTALLIRAYAWVTILKNNGVINNFLMHLGVIDTPIQILNTKIAVIIGTSYCYLPFMLLPIYSALSKIDRSLIEASQDLGSKPLSTFINITLPLSFSGILVGSLLVFIPAVGEFVLPDLLGGSQVFTIGKVIWSEFFLNRDWTIASAITIVFVFLTFLPIVLLQKFLKRGML